MASRLRVRSFVPRLKKSASRASVSASTTAAGFDHDADGGRRGAEVLFAGAQGGLVGLDQCNLRLPPSLAGRGEVDVALSVEGKASNTVKVRIR